MKKYVLGLIGYLFAVTLMLGMNVKVHASSGEEMIAITIDASDDNSGLLYAIDSDAPEAFSESNTFNITEGTTHVIYVKDAAGNISAQTYTHDAAEEKEIALEEPNIEVAGSDAPIPIKYEYEDNLNYEYLTDTKIDNSDANVISKTTTDGSDLAEKVFYVITTKEGEEFFLVIEQGSSNKVHLLNTVTIDDLTALAEGDSSKTDKKEEDNLLKALMGGETTNSEETISDTGKNGEEATKTAKNSNNILIYILVAIAGVAYYYFKIYKNKKNESMDAMDAMDMDEFYAEDDEDEEELEFDDKEKQELLEQLIYGQDESEDEGELLQISPDEYIDNEGEEIYTEEIYATSHEKDISLITEEDIESELLEETLSDEYDEDLDGEEEE